MAFLLKDRKKEGRKRESNYSWGFRLLAGWLDHLLAGWLMSKNEKAEDVRAIADAKLIGLSCKTRKKRDYCNKSAAIARACKGLYGRLLLLSQPSGA